MSKNVALSDRIYKDLKKLKGRGESFSSVIIRLMEKGEKPSWRDSVGALEDDKESEKIFNNILENRHKNKARGARFKW